jgi:aspartate/methionine/tyrosine aminotransferase
MLSSRTRFELQSNRLAEALRAKRRAGRPLLDLTESNPTRAGLAYPKDLLLPLSSPRALVYEPSPRGLASARAAVVRDHARRGLTVADEQVVLTASTSEAYAWLFKLLCDPGDSVLVPRPGYPLFDYLAGLESVTPVSYPLAYDGEWHLDRPALAQAIRDDTRAVVVVTPGNPTGAFLKKDEAEWLLDLCAARGLALVSDEVFADYAWSADPRRAPSVAASGPALAFALGGLSKSCGLPQLKLGWIVVSGPARLRDPVLARLELIADTYLSVNTPVQVAAAPVLERIEELQGPIRRRLRANFEALRRALVPPAPATVLGSEGGWSAALRVPATVPEEERALRLLEAHDVVVHPGYFFDFPTEAHLVVSLLTEEATFAEGVARLARDLVL